MKVPSWRPRPVRGICPRCGKRVVLRTQRPKGRGPLAAPLCGTHVSAEAPVCPGTGERPVQS